MTGFFIYLIIMNLRSDNTGCDKIYKNLKISG